MKMKKFMNAPETVTDEELIGLGLAYPDILEVDGHLVISKDLAAADRVTIVTYGGSGHEPAQAGFVGKGMLDVQAVGDIFAAPNGQLVFDAMKLADKGHGVLLLTLNYAGDQLAGKQAMKLAKKAGLNVRQVVTGEEIQYDPNGEDNKRGLAGAVALYHIAAAAAREGKSLDEVAEIAQRYADSMASITVKSTDATHPQNGMSFGDLGETDLMEIGAGQHGEGGGVRVPMMSSKDTVATVAEALCKALDLKPGDKTFVMINGCGATTMMEMLVLFKDTVEFLKAKGVEVVASMVGEILTVQQHPARQLPGEELGDEAVDKAGEGGLAAAAAAAEQDALPVRDGEAHVMEPTVPALRIGEGNLLKLDHKIPPFQRSSMARNAAKRAITAQSAAVIRTVTRQVRSFGFSMPRVTAAMESSSAARLAAVRRGT